MILQFLKLRFTWLNDHQLWYLFLNDNQISDISDVVFGISDVLDLGISFLITNPKQRDKIKDTIRMGLGLVKTTYGDRIQEYNLDTALFEYLG